MVNIYIYLQMRTIIIIITIIVVFDVTVLVNPCYTVSKVISTKFLCMATKALFFQLCSLIRLT